MYDVFISYSVSDGSMLAKAVAEMLEKIYLLDVFIADEEAQTKDSIDSKIREAIAQSKRALALFTDNAITSQWVEGEISLALEMEKEIIVCRNKSVERQRLPVRLVDKEQIVFTDTEDLLESLKKIEWGLPLIIPAAGKSGGLYPLNMGMPKVLLPVGDKPILHRIIEKLEPGVFSKVIILTDARFSEMVEYYAGLLKTEIPLKCMRSPAPTLPLAIKKLSLETTFIIHYCDIIIEDDFDWKDFIAHHKFYRKRNKVVGTLMASNSYKLAVGRIKNNDKRLLTDFTEKPESIESTGYSINMAVSIFEPEFLSDVYDEDRSLYGHTLIRAMNNNKKFSIYRHEKWRHIQTLSDWYEAQNAYLPSEEDCQ